ncbi:long-chain fatty acid--CoA ligase [Nostoc sp. TCL240-02]|nr:long-chain fatty acid--CoA ligase [Nostoc sp. TCL240-02]
MCWVGLLTAATVPHKTDNRYNHNLKYKFGSIGVSITNVQMRIVDADGYQVSAGELGEIVIKGSNVMLGYWNRPQETQKVIKNGWLHSGDIGRMDEEAG